MKHYLLQERTGLPIPSPRDRTINPWEPWYDTMNAIVVYAEDETTARATAANNASDEGREAWLHDKFSTCVTLDSIDDEVVLKSEQWA